MTPYLTITNFFLIFFLNIFLVNKIVILNVEVLGATQSIDTIASVESSGAINSPKNFTGMEIDLENVSNFILA